MTRFLAAIAAIAALAGPAAAQTFSSERIKADIGFLADDLLEGRNAGTRGYDIAAQFVAGRFAALGLQPANNGSFLQPVPFVIAKLKPDATNDAPSRNVTMPLTVSRAEAADTLV